MNEKPDTMPAGYGELTFGTPRSLVLDSLEKVWRFATMVIRAKMAPTGMETPEAICIAVLHGAELGMSPFMALQRIAIINGRPTIWGDAALAIVMKSGLLENIEEWIDGEGDARTATCRVTRKGFGPRESTFSVYDAKVAGLWDDREKIQRTNRTTGAKFEAKNDAPWKRHPDRMLKMRARGFALRDNFADALGGMYLREEFLGGQVIDHDVAELSPPTPPIMNAPPEPPVTKQYVDDNAGGPPEPPAASNEPPEPPPPPPGPSKLDSDEADRLVAMYIERLQDVQTDAALDILWNDMILPLIDADRLDDSVLNKLQELDDERRGLIQTHGGDHDR